MAMSKKGVREIGEGNMHLTKTYKVTCLIAVTRSDVGDDYSSYTKEFITNLDGPDKKQASKILGKEVSKDNNLKWDRDGWIGDDQDLIEIQDMVLVDVNLKEKCMKDKDKCPRCGQKAVVSLSNPFISGGVLMCTKCKSVSPHAETTIKAMAYWEDSIKKI